MIINKKSLNLISTFAIVYKGSVNNEQKGLRGVSHLSEHLLCTALDHLQDDFTRECINFNAYTSNNEIVFYMSGLESSINKYRDTFINLLTNHIPTIEQFEKERNIVTQELFGCFSDQSSAHYYNLLRTKFDCYGAIGNENDLEQLDYDTYIEFHKSTYKNPHNIINISKDFEYVNDNITFTKETPSKVYSNGSYSDNLPLITNNFLSTDDIVLYNPSLIIDNKDTILVKFISTMLSLGLNSPLYKYVREEKNLVYYIYSTLVELSNEQSFIYISTQTKKETKNETIEAINYVLSNNDKYITEERFNDIKQYYTNKKKYNENINDSVSNILKDENKSIIDNIDTINFRDVQVVFEKYFKPEMFEISLG